MRLGQAVESATILSDMKLAICLGIREPSANAECVSNKLSDSPGEPRTGWQADSRRPRVLLGSASCFLERTLPQHQLP
ncbi:hypothetical protein CLOM_g2738 [Closterium sp. NIES-68]|nr:hypothetical protein CLOM_g2738 [Closterium sp. NIES-68]GJP67925.1 hypothetical protein CLOP_g24683 [Closterium sp. NIES-67]GJP70712.1 hypothetical protein CLOP_g1622 [Closterium sp. NIES-67]